MSPQATLDQEVGSLAWSISGAGRFRALYVLCPAVSAIRPIGMLATQHPNPA